MLPPELRVLPYDVDSVMHFEERDFSKNGHRSFIIKNRNTKQNRNGLSKTDLRKIEIVYGDECKKRDRQAKLDSCKWMPSVELREQKKRRKREIIERVQSLRINPDITPPPEKTLTDELENRIKALAIENEIQNLIEQVHKIAAKALENARIKHCNDTDLKVETNITTHDMIEVIEETTNYINFVVNKALTNLTVFCDNANSIDAFQRVRCGYGTGNRCPMSYKSTKSGAVKYSTQHRPYIIQSTKHDGKGRKIQFDSWLRASNNTEAARRKRDVSENFTLNTNARQDEIKNTTPNLSENSLTTIAVQKVVNFAPVRRFHGRGPRLYGSKEKHPEESSSNLSFDNNKKKAMLDEREPKKSLDIEILNDKYKEKRREKYKEKKRVNIEEDEDEEEEEEEEDSPKLKRLKKRKDRKRIQEPETVKLSKDNREFYTERMWPDGVVRYVIKEDSRYNSDNVRASLEEVNDILKKKTCVRLEEISEREGDRKHRYRDYLVLDTSADYVTGRVGGKQVRMEKS
ncbi:unnamed protein product [Euphydryas editha]|uniref:Peptidase M12A domain-containing protein n=1 Tax=Euphydryas editha TaxID=104508 RepID=A0AAU9TD31_EUPED|nr:unnamed protein product [Euphydryas editha]